jgi:hypothetical protein
MSEILNPESDVAALAEKTDAETATAKPTGKTCGQQPIIVLGMHRSGTSLLAELIDKWGAFGNGQFLAADYRNSQGYWEYEPLVHFNRRLLVSVQSQSFVPPSDEAEVTLSKRAHEPAWRNEALQLVAAMQAAQRPWYWKDPRLAVTLVFWQQFWNNPIYVISVREPVDTALSLRKIYGLPLTAGYVMWQRYVTSTLKCTHQEPRRIFVEYEQLLAAPGKQCSRLCSFLQQRCRMDDGLREKQRLEAMLQVVNPGLRTNADSISFFSTPEANAGQKDLYRYLQAMADDEEAALEPAAFEIFAGWRDYLQTLATVDKLRHTVIQQEQTLGLRIHRKVEKLTKKPAVEELPW